MDFIAKFLYILALPFLKVVKPEMTTYDVQDVTYSSFGESFHRVVLGAFGTGVVVVFVLWALYQLPQEWYGVKRNFISSDESSPLVKDSELKGSDAIMLTPKSKQVEYIQKPKIDNPQDEVDALKQKLKNEKSVGDS